MLERDGRFFAEVHHPKMSRKCAWRGHLLQKYLSFAAIFEHRAVGKFNQLANDLLYTIKLQQRLIVLRSEMSWVSFTKTSSEAPEKLFSLPLFVHVASHRIRRASPENDFISDSKQEPKRSDRFAWSSLWIKILVKIVKWKFCCKKSSQLEQPLTFDESKWGWKPNECRIKIFCSAQQVLTKLNCEVSELLTSAGIEIKLH